MTTHIKPKAECKCDCHLPGQAHFDMDYHCYKCPHQPDQTSDWREEFCGNIKYVNPNCIYPQFCEPHGEQGEVYYSGKNVLIILDQQEQRHQREMIEECERQYEKLQESKYYKELTYIEKQVYLSGVEHLTQALDQISQSIKNKK